MISRGVPLLDEDYLILSTIHSAKGQEWKAIFVLNAVDGCIPSDLGAGTTAELEEERRLLYVAMTRAKDQSASCRAAALLHPWAERSGRSACLCLAHTIHSRPVVSAFRMHHLACRRCRIDWPAGCKDSARRRRRADAWHVAVRIGPMCDLQCGNE